MAEKSELLTSAEFDAVRHELKNRWGGRLELVNAG